VGIAVILAAGWQLRRRAAERRLGAAALPASGAAAAALPPSRAAPRRAHLPPVAGWAAGFASGALTTSISVSGPPIVLWLEARGVRPEEFRASLAASFLALNLAGGAVLLVAEGSGALDAAAVAPLLALVAAGYALGALAFRRLDRERFFAVVLVLVAATGVASVVAGLV